MLQKIEFQRSTKPGFGRVGLVAMAVACSHAGAMAQRAPASDIAASQSPSFVIKGFDITGDNPLPDGEASRILAPYLRTNATLETLQQATSALEAALKSRGYALHRVALPPQEVGSSVTLNIVKFVIGKITIEGRERYSEANIRRSLPELAEGTAPNFRTLANQTAIANESQGKQVQVALKESDEADKIDARIVVRESKPMRLSLGLANSGSRATGNDRLTLAVGHANLFDLDHQLTAAYTTSIARARDVRQVGLNYRVPLYRWGGVVGLSLTRSDVAGDFGAFKSSGAGRTLGLNYNHYLPPIEGYRGFVAIGFDDKQFDVTQVNGVPLPGQALRRSRPLSLGYTARIESDTSVWGYNLEAAFNLSGGAGNDLAAHQTEDARISTARWKALRGGGNYVTSFAGGWLWNVRGQFQYSTDTLISGEQFGLGGATSVRGTGERPISGDSGLLVSMEVSTRELAPGLRLLGFVDAGWLGNNSPNGNPKPQSDGLASVGIGLRYAVSNFDVSAEYGRMAKGTNLPFVPGSSLPQSGDQKLHVNLSVRF